MRCHPVVWAHFDDVTFTNAFWIRQKLCWVVDLMFREYDEVDQHSAESLTGLTTFVLLG